MLGSLRTRLLTESHYTPAFTKTITTLNTTDYIPAPFNNTINNNANITVAMYEYINYNPCAFTLHSFSKDGSNSTVSDVNVYISNATDHHGVTWNNGIQTLVNTSAPHEASSAGDVDGAVNSAG
ncbi:MAG: hypothetical protein Q9213_000800 [Squamulea squamosa]